MKVFKSKIKHQTYYVVRFYNTINFPLDIDSKHRQFKNNPIIIINQINLGRWVYNFFPFFKHMVMANYNASNNNSGY